VKERPPSKIVLLMNGEKAMMLVVWYGNAEMAEKEAQNGG
jgi:hypothetical protein